MLPQFQDDVENSTAKKLPAAVHNTEKEAKLQQVSKFQDKERKTLTKTCMLQHWQLQVVANILPRYLCGNLDCWNSHMVATFSAFLTS